MARSLSQTMKRILPLMLLLVSPSLAIAQAAEANDLEEFVRMYEAAWQAHDAERLGEFFSEDADMIIGILPWMIGRDAIVASWSRYFSRIDNGRLLTISIESIRSLSPNVALINVETTTGGNHSETNEVLPSRKARGTWVVTRHNNDWQISALRAHSPIGERREAPGTDK